MRSGFLNVSSEAGTPAMEKASRNKRKFRTDQHQQCNITASVPVHHHHHHHHHECDANKQSVANAANANAETPNSGTLELSCKSACCSCQNSSKSNSSNNSNSTQINIQQVPCDNNSVDSQWDQFSESQLEEILMSMLDLIFKEALRKIMSHDVSQEDALNAVLRSGKWVGGDTLMCIVEGSLAWLQSEDRGSVAIEPLFSHLKEMENHLLAEMIYVLREVRPNLSRGDAMWCLLMCDLNVLLACTMKEDSLPSSLKDGNAPSSLENGNVVSSSKDVNSGSSLKAANAVSSVKIGSLEQSLKGANAISSMKNGSPEPSSKDANAVSCMTNGSIESSSKEANAVPLMKSGNEPLSSKIRNETLSLKNQNETLSLKNQNETLSSNNANARPTAKDGNEPSASKNGNPPFSTKTGNQPSVQSKTFPDMSSMNFSTFEIPQSLRMSSPSEADVAPFDLLASCNASFFSKVMKACCKGASAKFSKTVQTCTSIGNSSSVFSCKESELQTEAYQLTASQIQALEEHCTKLGLLISPQDSGTKKFVSCQNGTSQKLLSASGCASSILYEEIVKVINKQYISQSSDPTPTTSLSEQSAPAQSNSNKISVSKQSTSLQLCLTSSKSKGKKCNGSWTNAKSSNNNKEMQINLQIHSTKATPSDDKPTTETVANSNASPSVVEFSVKREMPKNIKGETSNGQHDPDISLPSAIDNTDSNTDERKDVMLSLLNDRAKYLETQLQGWSDWAQQKVMQAARRLAKDSTELKALRQEREEYMRLKKEKQSLEEGTMKKLAEMENALRKALNQVDRANSAAWRLESENAEVRAEMEAAKLTAAESVVVCNEATNRAKKSMRQTDDWEKQKQKLQSDLTEGKRSLSKLTEQLLQAKERHQQIEAKCKEAKRAKEEALMLFEAEKRAKERLECSIKRKEEKLRVRLETDSKRYQDDVLNLEREICRLKLSSGVKPSISWEDSFRIGTCNLDSFSAENLKRLNDRLLSEISDIKQSHREVRRDRECIMCMSDETSVLFLPCAHQILCIKCNENHQRKGLRECPSCRALIKKRIQVYGVRS